jgi:hypothetical protein
MSESGVDEHAAHVNNIHYVCAANDHGELSAARNALSPLTVHEDLWAWCSAGVPTGHSWRSIYPTTLAEITQLMRSST